LPDFEHALHGAREDFEQFGSKLMPLLDEFEINAGEPQVREVYKMDNP
jgi:hypothetical protein